MLDARSTLVQSSVANVVIATELKKSPLSWSAVDFAWCKSGGTMMKNMNAKSEMTTKSGSLSRLSSRSMAPRGSAVIPKSAEKRDGLLCVRGCIVRCSILIVRLVLPHSPV
jgi:hypothetical protein